jgi:hypothetical protein
LGFCWNTSADETEDWRADGGVRELYVELRVEVDFVVGTVPLLALLASLDSVDLSVRKLALDRLRRSLKKGAMMTCRGLRRVKNQFCAMQLT